MSFPDNPRGWLIEQLVHTFVGGFKAIRYGSSARYRKRVHEHWLRYPRMRWRGIARMIIGSLLLLLVLATVILMNIDHTP